MIPWRPAYVGIGSNLGDSVRLVVAAFDSLAAAPGIASLVRAPLYRTPPFGPVAQPHFVNSAAGFLTTLDARALFATLRAIERALGREPARVRWGPRTIDLDLLVLGRERIAEEALQLPHPGIGERAFVLLPLAAIAPDLEIPGMGTVRELRDQVAADGIERLP
ncbi:MAG: 2-amino-4-hydroxy-6-hydroxymethyldihydropteridine pyrophosphokinase [Steroidobacteraceae bacterium]|nr:2-amino-4-hydroxy-6-hydroxymethyldihydropteridine pyrophosphokinase [Steroidobacteraceae bacterium]